MKHSTNTSFSHMLRWLIAWMVLIGLVAGSAIAESSGLNPGEKSYEGGNIVLNKNAERVGPDEWKVTVKASIGETPVEKRQMEVVFLVDRSSSMDEIEHTHDNNCFERTCEKPEHTHEQDTCYGLTCEINEQPHDSTCYSLNCEDYHEHTIQACYERCTKHKKDNQHRNNGCIQSGGAWYSLTCEIEEHTEHTDSCYTFNCTTESHHIHDATKCYQLTCTLKEHEHASGCYQCIYYVGGDTRDTTVDRLDVVSVAAERLIANLPADTTTITRLAFDGGFYSNISSYYDVSLGSGTQMWDGIYETFRGNYFSDNPNTKKVFVILTDGATSGDSYKTAAENYIESFKSTEGTNGAVFTIGFATSSQYNDTLRDIAGNGGSFLYADNASSIATAFDQLEQTLTAMLEDPMGTAVGFEASSIQQIHTSNGVISSSGDTIYWNPAENGSTSVNNSVIEYSYTVQLNEQADMSVGLHTGVPLNKPTYFYYGIKDKNGTTNMNEVLFPIPEAEYALSSIQTKWQCGGEDIQTPTDVERIICDHQDAEYIPAFKQDYRTITPIIPMQDSNDYYQYIGTTVTANNREVAGVDAVDATEPVAYVVIHQYELIKANELAVGGTKTLIGRDFLPGDSFTFTLTAETADAPMPEGAFSPQSITITPASGTSAAFSFGTISYNKAGTYAYTIQEQAGSLDGVIYDTREHRLVVTVRQSGNQMVASYTLDGVESGHLTVTNRLQTGMLKIEKRSVISHLPEHQEKAFSFLVSVKDASSRPLNGSYEALMPDGSTQTLTFTNGMTAVTLKQGESVVISDLPDGAAYTVTERATGGFSPTATGDAGTIEANQQREAVFDNTYQSAGRYQFIGTKQVVDASLAQNQFTFSVLDETGAVVARGKNNADGSFFLDTLFFTQEDIGPDGTGEKTYTIVEDLGTEPGYIYDRTRYEVTLTLMDNGEGVISVADDLNGMPLVFVNRHITGQFAVSKTVEGNLGSKNRDFPFTLTMPDMAGKTISVSTDGGATFTEMTLNAQGTHTFTLRDGQSIIFSPVSGAYIVTETDPGSYTTTYSIDQGAAVNGTRASGNLDESGGHVAFVNTLQAIPPTGVRTSSVSALMGLCLAACLIAITRAGRRCSCHDE